MAHPIFFMVMILLGDGTLEKEKEPPTAPVQLNSEEIADRGSRGSREKPSFYDELRIEREWKDRREKRISRRDETLKERAPKARSRASRS